MSSVRRVFISGGRETGGVRAFASALGSGFEALGYEVVVVENVRHLWRLHRFWRDHRSIWILSTWALFFAPFLRRSVGVAHGWPLPVMNGFIKAFTVYVALRFCSFFAPLVSVSGYVSMQLSQVWGLKSRAVIHNPLRMEIIEERRLSSNEGARRKICYIGRLVDVKRVDLLIDAFEALGSGVDGYELVIVGQGPQRHLVEAKLRRISRALYIPYLDAGGVRDLLLQSKVFYNGCLTEAFGISLLEARCCGANVVCPSVGGFIEVAIEDINSELFLFSPVAGVAEVQGALERAIGSGNERMSVDAFTPKNIALKYLEAFS